MIITDTFFCQIKAEVTRSVFSNSNKINLFPKIVSQLVKMSIRIPNPLQRLCTEEQSHRVHLQG